MPMGVCEVLLQAMLRAHLQSSVDRLYTEFVHKNNKEEMHYEFD